MNDNKYKCLMPFTDQSESFTHGFECGQIWEMAKAGKLFDYYLIHYVNEGQIGKILDLYGYEYTLEIIDNTWMTIFSGSNKSELN